MTHQVGCPGSLVWVSSSTGTGGPEGGVGPPPVVPLLSVVLPPGVPLPSGLPLSYPVSLGSGGGVPSCGVGPGGGVTGSDGAPGVGPGLSEGSGGLFAWFGTWTHWQVSGCHSHAKSAVDAGFSGLTQGCVVGVVGGTVGGTVGGGWVGGTRGVFGGGGGGGTDTGGTPGNSGLAGWRSQMYLAYSVRPSFRWIASTWPISTGRSVRRITGTASPLGAIRSVW